MLVGVVQLTDALLDRIYSAVVPPCQLIMVETNNRMHVKLNMKILILMQLAAIFSSLSWIGVSLLCISIWDPNLSRWRLQYFYGLWNIKTLKRIHEKYLKRWMECNSTGIFNILEAIKLYVTEVEFQTELLQKSVLLIKTLETVYNQLSLWWLKISHATHKYACRR